MVDIIIENENKLVPYKINFEDAKKYLKSELEKYLRVRKISKVMRNRRIYPKCKEIKSRIKRKEKGII